MYSRPSSSTRCAPCPSRKKTGVPPTARNARTGELTPPGISCCERSKRARLRSCITAFSRCGFVEARERARGALDVGRLEERRDHGEQVGAGLHHARSIVDRDAADRRYGEARGAS